MSAQQDDEELIAAIRRLHGCEARWIVNIPTEVRSSMGSWKGAVQLYELIHHRTAVLCYAWVEISKDGNRRQHAVIRKDPVLTAAGAVRLAIEEDAR